MEEGSLRCDANISVRKKGSKIFNSRVEIKNLNSFSNVQKAIEIERNRQVLAYENGESIEQETRNYNAKNNSTIVLRKKEDAHDYRYFPEPDIQPIMISDEMIRELKKTMPSLPNELFKKYTNNYKLSIYDSKNLTENKNLSLFFQSVIKFTKQYKIAANIIMGVIKGYLNENSKNISDLELKPIFIAELSDMIHNNEINNSIASQKIFPEMLKDFEKSPKEIAKEKNYIQEKDNDLLMKYVKDALEKFPNKVLEYKNGKKNLLGLFMGEAMKNSKGTANPKLLNQLIIKELES